MTCWDALPLEVKSMILRRCVAATLLDESLTDRQLKSPRLGDWLIELVKTMPELMLELGKCVHSLAKELNLEEARLPKDTAKHRHAGDTDCAACIRSRRIDWELYACEDFLDCLWCEIA